MDRTYAAIGFTLAIVMLIGAMYAVTDKRCHQDDMDPNLRVQICN